MNHKKLRLVLGILLATVVLVLVTSQKSDHWWFYTKESVGANNKLALYPNLVFDTGNLYFNVQNGKTISLRQDSGKVNWQFQADKYSPFSPILEEDKIFLANFDGKIYALNKNSGHKLWQFSIPNDSIPDTPVTTQTNSSLVFVGSRTGTLYALDKTTGKMTWSKQFPSIDTTKPFVLNSIHFGSLYLHQDTLYVWQAVTGQFLALDAQTGQEKWSISNLEFNFRSPLFYQQRVILSQSRALLSIDAQTGKHTQLVTHNSNPPIAVKVVGDSNYLIVLHDQTLKKTSLDLQNRLWEIAQIDHVVYQQFKIAEPSIELYAKKLLTQRHLLTERVNLLLAVDYNSGQISWQKEIVGNVEATIAQNQHLLVGSDTGHISSLTTDDGKTQWQQQVDGKVLQILEAQKNLLVIGEKAGQKIELSYFNPQGQLLWRYVPDWLIDSQEIYHYQDNVFTLNTNKNLLEKIKASDQEIKNHQIVAQNFELIANKDSKDPYLEFKLVEKWTDKLKGKIQQIKYVISNITNLWHFEMETTPQTHFLAITITHDEQLYQNKFLDLEIIAEFSKDQRKYTVKAFYLDHNTWQVRFLPDEPGLYQYRLKIKSPYLYKTIKGEVNIETHRQEKISVQENQFVINNQEAFLPLGIQDAFFDHNYNGQYFDELPASNLLTPTTDSQNYAYLSFGEYLDVYQQEAGINIFRYGVENWTPPLWNSLDLANFDLSVSGGLFGDHLLKELKNRQLKTIMTVFGFYPPFRSSLEISNPHNQRAIAAYLDYVIARFGSTVDLWEIANEAEPSSAWYDFVINYLKENDPYHLPVSTNWESKQAKGLDFLSVHWYNPIRQNAELTSGDINYLVKKYQPHQQAVLISEIGFKDKSWFENSSTQMRLMSWLSTMQNMGMIFWTNGQNGIYENKDNANIYLGPRERAYLKILREFLPTELLTPIKYDSFSLVREQAQVYTMSNQGWYLAYLLKVNPQLDQTAIELELDLPQAGKLTWYDPASGLVIGQETINSGKQKVTAPTFQLDLALKIKYLNSND